MKGLGLVPDARMTSNGGQGTKDLHIHHSSTDLEFLTPACGRQGTKNEITQPLSVIPEEVVQAFAEIYELNRERNLQILRQIDDITIVLNKEIISLVFLKGTGNLSGRFYAPKTTDVNILF